jgi:hypothetical protein
MQAQGTVSWSLPRSWPAALTWPGSSRSAPGRRGADQRTTDPVAARRSQSSGHPRRSGRLHQQPAGSRRKPNSGTPSMRGVVGGHWRSGRLLVDPGSGHRASTSRYPLVTALSPVAGAPLGIEPAQSPYVGRSAHDGRPSTKVPCTVAVMSIQMPSPPFPIPARPGAGYPL